MNRYELLKNHFGYDTFRHGQESVIDNIMNSRDVLAIMPTGGGKSICYQLPALMSEGVTIVISPLIALMKDQVDSLVESGIQATYLNSSLSDVETNNRIENIIQGKYKLIYVAPERLLKDSFYYLSKQIIISLIAVDEAHCISQWGHDFRPSYRDIPRFISRLERRPVIAAFTATATKGVINEIKALLELREPYELITGFDRENLFYKVIKPKDRFRYLRDYLKHDFTEGSGIIYCSTRKAVESLSMKLVENGFSVGAYHGGMDSETRTVVQDSFMMDETKIIVATNAFGMGIDKPDVRFVIHYNMPKNMEAYYQEAGRAGRDGKKSDCVLMYSPADIVKQKLIISQNLFSIEREQIQLENLQKLVNYCHTNDCLRKEIISYFGEEATIDNCRSCGNCLDDSEFVDMTIESQKILSCIYRTNQRFGVNIIIQVLRGSRNKKILDWNLDKVSTYGIITDYSEGGLRELIMNLIARGFIAMTTDKFPVLKLQECSRKVLKGEEKIFIRKERVEVKDKKKKQQKRKTDFDFDQALFDLLCEKRKAIAEEKKVPLYVIFHNTTLEEVAYYMPTSKEKFMDIKGVGEKKFDNYGQMFIKIIQEFILDKGIDEAEIKHREGQMLLEVEVDESINASDTKGKSRYELTYEVYNQGLDLKEIAKKRGFSPSTIVKHLERLASEGYHIDLDRFIVKSKEKEILEAINKIGMNALKPIKDSVSDSITYPDIQLVLTKLQLSN